MSQIVEEIKGSYHPMSSSFIESSSSSLDKIMNNEIRSERNDADNILLSPSPPSTRRVDEDEFIILDDNDGIDSKLYKRVNNREIMHRSTGVGLISLL